MSVTSWGFAPSPQTQDAGPQFRNQFTSTQSRSVCERPESIAGPAVGFERFSRGKQTKTICHTSTTGGARHTNHPYKHCFHVMCSVLKPAFSLRNNHRSDSCLTKTPIIDRHITSSARQLSDGSVRCHTFNSRQSDRDSLYFTWSYGYGPPCVRCGP